MYIIDTCEEPGCTFTSTSKTQQNTFTVLFSQFGSFLLATPHCTHTLLTLAPYISTSKWQFSWRN